MRKVTCALVLVATCWISGFLVAVPSRSQEKKEAPVVKAIEVDAVFLEALADYQMISREIERIEAATGTVEIPVSLATLRQRSEAKVGRLKAWMKEHAVGDDWRYDAGTKMFVPTAPSAKAEPKRP